MAIKKLATLEPDPWERLGRPVAEGVKAELAEAVPRDGVLEITMPATAVEAKTRTLEIAEPVPGKSSRAA